MSLKVISPGLHTTVQDGGRYGYQDQGIPVSGFMDVTSANLANILVANNVNTALLEMMVLGGKFKAILPITIAVTGADMQVRVNGEKVKMYKAIQVPKNAIISFSGAIHGVYTYVAFCGGLKIPRILGSKATYTPAKIGGYKGRILEKGDELPVLHKVLPVVNTRIKAPVLGTSARLMCIEGPEYYLFSKESIASFFDAVFTISKDSNRMGIRLESSTVTLPNSDEIISSGIVKGTVQITKGGQPIVLMADAATTGGYLRMVNLTNASCNALAQIPVGGKVQFVLQK